MTKLDVVTQVANPILAGYEPSDDPMEKMSVRGFTTPNMYGALSDISKTLKDASKTPDGKAYTFTFDQAFVTDALGLNQISLDTAIDANTAPVARPPVP